MWKVRVGFDLPPDYELWEDIDFAFLKRKGKVIATFSRNTWREEILNVIRETESTLNHARNLEKD